MNSENHPITRRTFIAQGAVTTTVLAGGLPFLTGAAAKSEVPASDDALIEQLQRRAPASWMWTDLPVDKANCMAQFRLEFDWNGTGEVFWLGYADTLYTLWCNGEVLGVGPIGAINEQPYLSRWDLSGAVRRGRNVLALQVWTHGGRHDCLDIGSLESGVIGWISAGEQVVATGPRWKARVGRTGSACCMLQTVSERSLRGGEKGQSHP